MKKFEILCSIYLILLLCSSCATKHAEQTQMEQAQVEQTPHDQVEPSNSNEDASLSYEDLSGDWVGYFETDDQTSTKAVAGSKTSTFIKISFDNDEPERCHFVLNKSGHGTIFFSAQHNGENSLGTQAGAEATYKILSNDTLSIKLMSWEYCDNGTKLIISDEAWQIDLAFVRMPRGTQWDALSESEQQRLIPLTPVRRDGASGDLLKGAISDSQGKKILAGTLVKVIRDEENCVPNWYSWSSENQGKFGRYTFWELYSQATLDEAFLYEDDKGHERIMCFIDYIEVEYDEQKRIIFHVDERRDYDYISHSYVFHPENGTFEEISD